MIFGATSCWTWNVYVRVGASLSVPAFVVIVIVFSVCPLFVRGALIVYVPSPFFVGVRVVPSDAVTVVVSGFVSVTLNWMLSASTSGTLT